MFGILSQGVRWEGGRMKKKLSRLTNGRPDQPSPYSGDLIFSLP